MKSQIWDILLRQLVLFLTVLSYVQGRVLIDTYSDSEESREFLPNSHHHRQRYSAPKQNYEVCQTPACKKAAFHLLNAINMSVDPCEDFYEFSCGRWVQSHPIPPTESHRSTFEITTEKLHKQVREILEKPVLKSDLRPVKASKDAYRVCMDMELIAKDDVISLINLSKNLGGWPMASENWNHMDFDVFDIMAQMENTLAIGAFFSSGVACDRKNSTLKVITIDQPSLGLSRSMLTDSHTYASQITAYKMWIAKSAQMLADVQNFKVSPEDIEEEAHELVEFEIKLAELTTKSEMRRNSERLYNPMTLRRLQEWTDSAFAVYPHAQIDWVRYMQLLFVDVDTTIDAEERVIVREVDFLFKMVTLLDGTPPRVVANYMQWRLIRTVSPETTQEMRALAFEFEKVLIGVEEMLPRWRVCVLKVSGLLSYAVGYEYVRAHFDTEAKESAKSMVANIRAAFSERMSHVDWMDKKTRAIALDKANSMMEAIGYPDWYGNVTAVEDYYKEVFITESHFKNMIHLQTIGVLRSLKKLRLPHDRSEWITSPEVVNAYYFPPTNTIIFPAGILQPPFFNKARSESLNYGSIGMVIGHEITHGFDDMGRQSDKYGNIAQWWSEETLETYLKKSQCFIDQYNNYRVPELDGLSNDTVTMNGINTQGENIADSGGVNTAFLAYQKYLNENGPEPRLPGLTQFNNDQLFFLGFGSTWCESIHKEALLNAVLTDAHSPHKFRVAGSLANSEDFARVFKCRSGSRMNPKNKCFIW